MKQSFIRNLQGSIILLIFSILFLTPNTKINGNELYPSIPRCNIYQVKANNEDLPVFQNQCPVFELGKQGMLAKDKKPLGTHAGKSISWTNVEWNKPLTIKVKILDTDKVKPSTKVRVLPSRHKVNANVEDGVISFHCSDGHFELVSC